MFYVPLRHRKSVSGGIFAQISFLGTDLKHYLDKKFDKLFTVQAIRNITNFSCKKFVRISEFVRILCLNSCTKFAKNSSTNSCANSCLKITFLRKKIWGKVSVSLILPEIFQCRVLSAWADIEIH